MEGVWASEVSLSLPPSLYPNTVFHPAVALDSECLFSVFNFFSSPSFLPFEIVGGLGGEGGLLVARVSQYYVSYKK